MALCLNVFFISTSLSDYKFIIQRKNLLVKRFLYSKPVFFKVLCSLGKVFLLHLSLVHKKIGVTPYFKNLFDSNASWIKNNLGP